MSGEEHETEILRGMSPAQKLAVAQALYRQAWDLKTAGVRWLHPDWTDAQVATEIRSIFGRLKLQHDWRLVAEALR